MNIAMTKTETIKKTRDAEATKKRILDAAKHEFAQNGFDGARVDKIANLAQINKQMLYHYFGNKDELFKLVLEEAYRSLREYESCVDLNHLPANEAILALIEFTWSHYLEHPELISLLTVENQMEAKHLKKNRSIKKINEHKLFKSQDTNFTLLVSQGLLVGIITGLIGAGGGFLIVPALVMLLKINMKEAVATSLFTIALNSLIGFTSSLDSVLVDWQFLLTFASLSISGILVGVLLSKKIEGKKLKPIFGWVVLVMGIYVILRETIFQS